MMNVCKLIPPPSTPCSQGSPFFPPFPLQPQDAAHDNQPLPTLHMERVDSGQVRVAPRQIGDAKQDPGPSERSLLASYLRQNQSLTSSQVVGGEVVVLPPSSFQRRQQENLCHPQSWEFWGHFGTKLSNNRSHL